MVTKKWPGLQILLATVLLSLLAANTAPAVELPHSFPQYPLQTGYAGTVAPNVMLILDDSTSMGQATMPMDTYNPLVKETTGIYNTDPDDEYDTPYYRGYINNTIYYNPNVTYLPWRKGTFPGSTDRFSQADFREVPSSSLYISSFYIRLRRIIATADIDLRNSQLAYFYIPKPGISNPRENVHTDYYKYRIARSTAVGSYNGGIIQRCTRSDSNCREENEWKHYSVNETPLLANGSRRSQQDELQNIANWFKYHSSRMKMAKSGVFEAFANLDYNFRVGYHIISAGRANENSRPDPKVEDISLPIPYDKNNGLFEGDNRTKFFELLQDQGVYSSTPLRRALDVVGRYFKEEDPYKESDDTLLSCRKNYAILTTDGYWNGREPRKPKDSYYDFDSLAAIADYYWKTDLRTDLANDVPTSPKDNANWQHMNTFGISIGLGGKYTEAPTPTGGPFPYILKDSEYIDDLAQAAGEGRGEFFLANNTADFADALSKVLATIGARTASGSNAASSSNKLADNTLDFSASFNSGTWLGDLSASHRDSQHTPPTYPLSWVLSTSFAENKANADFSERTVLTSYGGSPRLFNKSTITGSEFKRDEVTPVSIADNIDYLRGIQALEGKNGLRQRAWPLGDIVNSTPFYVKDTETVYIGANDGMLHAIHSPLDKDANDKGKILFSYVPGGLNFKELASLSSQTYQHRFFVDGQIDVSTKEITPNKNILIAAAGRGARGVFALDVTDPENMGTAQVLWDNTTQGKINNLDMGYVLSRIRIRRGNGDKIWALVPNGIESPNDKAVLFAYELNTDGTIAKTHKLVTNNETDNGLMALGMADINADGLIDIVYGGDLQGNVWRWDFSTDKPGEATLLFKAVDKDGYPQAITGGITNSRSPDGDLFVGFATGRFIDEYDVLGGDGAHQVQTVYGVMDSTATISGRNDLQEREIIHEGVHPFDPKKQIRAFEPYSLLITGKRGWYLDLPAPERVVTDVVMMGPEAMTFTSMLPPEQNDDMTCESGSGSGWINAINLFTGTTPDITISGGYFRNIDPIVLINGEVIYVGSVAMPNDIPTGVNIKCDPDKGVCDIVVGDGSGTTIPGDGECAPGMACEEGTSLTSTTAAPRRVLWRSLR